MSYYTKITTAGLAAITAAMNNSSKVPITYMAFGDGNGYIPEPDENATSLVNEVYRVGVNKVEVHSKNPNWLVCEAIIPSAVGGFNIREVALYDSTGNTMLAIASYPPTYKPTVEEGAAKIQTIRIVIQVDNSGNFELIVDPDVVLATVEYVNSIDEYRKRTDTYKLLNFIPKQYHAEVFSGTSTRDFSDYINYATNEIRGDLIFPRGVVPIGKPVLLNRGVRFIGNGPFDTITTGSSRIKLLDGANCTAIQTPAAAGLGVSTHFMALENLLIEGNRSNQTEMHPLVQFHGAWVGSWLRNVFIGGAYGKALEFDKGADVQVDHLWIQDTVSGNDYALDFNPSYRGTSSRAGLMNMNHIYIENTGIESFDNAQSVNSPRNDPNNRGKALNLFALNSANINEIHIEGCLRPIDVDATHQTRIGKVSCAFVGKEGVDDVAIVRALGNGMMSLKVDTASITTGETGTVYGVKKAAGVNLPAIQDRALTGTVPSMVGYEAIASYTADTAKATPPLSVLQTVNVISRGGATPILKFHNSQDLTITSNQHVGVKYIPSGVGLYSTLNQTNNAETVLLDIITPTVAAGNSVRVYAPLRLIDERATANNIADGTITRVSTSQGKGLAYTFAASSFNFLSTVVVGTSAPTVAPNHIGQMFVDTTNGKAYISKAIDNSSDWIPLN